MVLLQLESWLAATKTPKGLEPQTGFEPVPSGYKPDARPIELLGLVHKPKFVLVVLSAVAKVLRRDSRPGIGQSNTPSAVCVKT